MPIRRACSTLVCLGLAFAAARVEAVIVTGSLGNNTSAPTDPALAVRWGQVGLFRPTWGPDGFLGTPIAPTLFITAKHIQGFVGDTFTLSGTTYTTIARFADSSSDLAIWQVSGTFPQDKIVPLYKSPTIPANAPLYAFGVGAARGTTVTGSAFGGGTELKGWRWGAYNPASPVQSWGTNTLEGVYSLGSAGLQLGFTFSAGVSDDEGTLAYGDSGGPVFIQQSGVWRLAGINYSVESPFNTTNTGGGFNAAVFDVGGLYYRNTPTTWAYQSPAATDSPAFAFSTSTTARLAWINGVIVSVPEPSTLAAAIVAALCLPLARLRRRA
jgi:hypothetical protein